MSKPLAKKTPKRASDRADKKQAARAQLRVDIKALMDATVIGADGKYGGSNMTACGQKLDASWRAIAKEWLRESQIWEVYISTLHGALGGVEKRKSDSARTLRDVLGDAGMQKTENDIFNFMCSVPRAYTIDFPIQFGVSLGAPELQLNSVLALCEGKSFPRNTLADLLGPLAAEPPPTPAHNALPTPSLRVRGRGYAFWSAEDSAPEFALSVLKQFVGLAMASGVMVFTPFAGKSLFSNSRLNDDKAGSEIEIALPEPVSRTLRRVIIPANAFSDPEGNKGVGLLSMAVPVPRDKRTDVLKRRLSTISRILTPRTKHVRHIRTAAEWMFDSDAESNETLALLFASIGLEAILDSPQNEVTARLGDRLAWLLGRTLGERNELSAKYATFYRVRCGLVHGRERRLDDGGREQLIWGQQTLRAVLAHELSHWPAEENAKKQKRS